MAPTSEAVAASAAPSGWWERGRLVFYLGRFHIVAIAAMGCLTFGLFLTGRYLPVVAAICALDWFLVNFVNRAVDVLEDRANGIVGTEYMAARARLFVPLSFGALALSLALAAPLGPTLLAFRVGYHALGVAYNYPLLPGRKRIKQLYFFKNLASAAGFVITLFAYPLAVAERTIAPAAAVALAAFFVLFELSYEVIYDLRDEEGDRRAGVATYAVVHGQRGAVRIVDALIGASLVVLAVAYAAGVVRWSHFIMFVAPLVQLTYYKRALRRGITSADCIALTLLGAFLLAVYHLWRALGLPGTGA